MMSCCASCGTAEGDDIQLKTCTACKSVRYCSITCQRNHRPKHKRACKKRAAELRDEILFAQPESSNFGDCPICCLPLPLDRGKSGYHPCCSKIVCLGCVAANYERMERERRGLTCPFCRDAVHEGDRNQKMMKRIQANDPNAMCEVGEECDEQGNYVEAFRHFSKAAELGDADAHFYLSVVYRGGKGVKMDKKKEIYHLEEAAIKGHNDARRNLAYYEERKGNIERSVRHLIIAAKLGDDVSISTLKKFYADGDVSKESFAAALRAYQAVVNATKSSQRDVAEQHVRIMQRK